MYIHYPALAGLVLIHALGFAGCVYLLLFGATGTEVVFHAVAYFLGGFGITALYHRSWTHNAVAFSRPVEYFFAVCSVFVPQMPAKQWISTHILHHTHTDEYADPYNIQRGFSWAHFEWIIFAPVPPVVLPERLVGNPVIAWQERYYWPLSAILNIVVPCVVSVASGSPWWGGLLLSCLRMAVMCNVVFAVNSVCHAWGTRPFSKSVSARDVWWFPFALGEQYHNYHHSFQRDYRHGIGQFDFDPTKWLIYILWKCGLASRPFAVPESRIRVARQEASSID